jgi:hypothetical protein
MVKCIPWRFGSLTRNEGGEGGEGEGNEAN